MFKMIRNLTLMTVVMFSVSVIGAPKAHAGWPDPDPISCVLDLPFAILYLPFQVLEVIVDGPPSQRSYRQQPSHGNRNKAYRSHKTYTHQKIPVSTRSWGNHAR